MTRTPIFQLKKEIEKEREGERKKERKKYFFRRARVEDRTLELWIMGPLGLLNCDVKKKVSYKIASIRSRNTIISTGSSYTLAFLCIKCGFSYCRPSLKLLTFHLAIVKKKRAQKLGMFEYRRVIIKDSNEYAVIYFPSKYKHFSRLKANSPMPVINNNKPTNGFRCSVEPCFIISIIMYPRNSIWKF